MSNVFGTDTSHWTGNIDFVKMASRGVKFNITKGSDINHTTKQLFVDAKAEINTHRAKEVGILTGLYHWLQMYREGGEQYWYHRRTIYDKVKPDFPAILDFEEKRSIGNNDYLYRAQQFLETAEAHDEKGRKPIIYTGEWFLKGFPLSKLKFLGRYPLWFARYTKPTADPFKWTILYKPYVNQIWDTWTFWQYSSSGDKTYYGTDGAVDENLFNGSLEELCAFLKVGAAPEPEPTPEQPPSVTKTYRVNAPDGLRVRTAPGGAQIASLKHGTVVSGAEQGDWVKLDAYSAKAYLEAQQ